jgi:hypothetical protein
MSHSFFLLHEHKEEAQRQAVIAARAKKAKRALEKAA